MLRSPSLTGRCGLAVALIGSFLVLGCATAPTTSVRMHTQRPTLVKSMFVMTPPGVYRDESPQALTSAGFSLQGVAQGLTTQISTKLNEAGNSTSTTLITGPAGTLRSIILERHKASGITEALVIKTKRASFANGLVRSIEIEAELYDARTVELLWEFSYENKNAGGGIVPDITQAVIESLRKSGFVR